jgi:hypothetical protein
MPMRKTLKPITAWLRTAGTRLSITEQPLTLVAWKSYSANLNLSNHCTTDHSAAGQIPRQETE